MEKKNKEYIVLYPLRPSKSILPIHRPITSKETRVHTQTTSQTLR